MVERLIDKYISIITSFSYQKPPFLIATNVYKYYLAPCFPRTQHNLVFFKSTQGLILHPSTPQHTHNGCEMFI
jgi:hypothetical protein